MSFFRIVYRGVTAALAVALIAGLAFYLNHSFGETTPTQATAEPSKPHEETKDVEIPDARLAAVGIELATAGPGVLRDSLRLNGTIQPNQETLVQVTPRFPGIVKDVRAHIGDRVAKGDVLAIVESNQSLTGYDLKAPISGTVIDRQASLGEYASEQKPAFVVADLSSVWVDFSVYRRDIARIRVGDTIMIDVEDGGPPIEGKISYVSPVGNSDTQSALARAVVANREMRLRPGLFVTGRLLLAAKRVGVAVKSEALQTIDNRPVVFVRQGEKFETRNVEIGAHDPKLIEITSGLADGDVYAAQNSFVIKAELVKGAEHED